MEATDPSRLAVLAASVFGELVSKRDRVAVFGLNQLSRTELRGSPEYFSSDRGAAAQLEPTGGLAEYVGGTPCRSALRKVRDLLNGLDAGENRRQVLLFLSDGRCDKGEEPEPSETWLAELEARANFRFYLVAFRGPSDSGPSEELYRYAKVSGEAEVLVQGGSNKDTARNLLVRFADILAESRNYRLPRRRDVEDNGLTFPNAAKVTVLEIEAGEVPQKDWRTWERPGKDLYSYRVGRWTPSEELSDHAVIIPDYGVLLPKIALTAGGCTVDESLDMPRGPLTIPPKSPFCVTVGFQPSAKPKAWLHRREDIDLDVTLDDKPVPKGRPGGLWQWAPPPFEDEGSKCITAIVTVGSQRLPVQEALTVLEQHFDVTPESSDLGRQDAGTDFPLKLNAEARGFTLREGRGEPLRATLEVAADDLACVELIRHEPQNIHLNANEVTVDLTVPRSCRRGGPITGNVRLVAFGMDSVARFTLTPVPTPWWLYWGPVVLNLLAGILAVVTLFCVGNGWRVPSRKLPRQRSDRALFYARAKRWLAADAADFKDIDDQKGAIPLQSQLGDRGWYRNAHVRLHRDGNLIRARSPRLLLELLPDKAGTLVLVRVGKTEVLRVNVDALSSDPDRFLSVVEWGRSRPTLGRHVGWPCRWYARLFGRMPPVEFIKADDGQWFQFGTPEEGELYLKVDRSPH